MNKKIKEFITGSLFLGFIMFLIRLSWNNFAVQLFHLPKMSITNIMTFVLFLIAVNSLFCAMFVDFFFKELFNRIAEFQSKTILKD